MKTFAIGDIHGCYKGLLQCLDRSGFDKKNDTLITLGDIVDGWEDVYECVEELLTIPNRIDIIGNHDNWLTDFIKYGLHPDRWQQGGLSTLNSYCKHYEKLHNMSVGYLTKLLNTDIPETHRNFFLKQKLYHLDHNNRLYVHGGFDRKQYIDYLTATNPQDFYWNRKLWDSAQTCSEGVKLKTNDDFKEIFIGHTATNYKYKDLKPVNSGGVWNIDQGAGWSDGKLTIMNVETKEFWQSDNTSDLYKNKNTRN